MRPQLLGLVSVASAVLTSCATGHHSEAALPQRSCAIVVYNQTPALHWDLDFFRAQADWYGVNMFPGHKQV